MSLVGPQAEAEMQKYNAHYVFLGTSGISLKKMDSPAPTCTRRK